MTTFQILLLIVCVWLLAATLFGAARGWITRRLALLLGVIWSVAAAVIIWPDVTSTVAHRVGIGRGTDLVVYCAIVAATMAFLTVSMRLRRLQQEMTVLVRRLALLEGRDENAR